MIDVETFAAAKAYTDAHGGEGGTSNYNALDNKPQINAVELSGNQTAEDLGLVAAVEGKGLSTNDYSDTEKGKVADNTSAIELLTSNEPADITSRLANLPTAVAQQNLEKYGYKIGDYFDGANYRYWLGHLNYNYGGYDDYAVLGTLNIGLVVDTKSNSQWNTSNDTTGGYESSALHTYLKGTVLDNIKADLKSLFGGSTGLEHLIAESKLFASIGTWGWSSSAEYISALTEVNMYGCPIWSVDGFQQGEADQQLEIFRKYKYNRIFGNNNVWLRSICSASEACLAHYYGRAYLDGASYSFRAAGLIIFH